MKKRSLTKSNAVTLRSDSQRSLYRIIGGGSDTEVKALVIAAGDPSSLAQAKNLNRALTIHMIRFVIDHGATLDARSRRGRKLTPQESAIAGLYALLCGRCVAWRQDCSNGDSVKKRGSYLVTKLAASDPKTTPLPRYEPPEEGKGKTFEETAVRKIRSGQKDLEAAGNQAIAVRLCDEALRAVRIVQPFLNPYEQSANGQMPSAHEPQPPVLAI